MVRKLALRAGAILGGCCLAVALIVAAAPAQARIFVGVGVPLFFPAYPYGYAYPYPYPYPYPDYAPPVAYTAPAPVAAQPQTWYYCDDPKGYYPYVSTCNQGWRQVPAKP
jgi:hypothetical protein